MVFHLALWALLAQAVPDLPPSYVIGADDVLDVQVFQAPDLSRTVRVDQRGMISLPLAGEVEVRGLTPPELERKLARLLGEKYLNQPTISVFVREHKSNPVSVIGAVKVPGVYAISGPKPLAEVLAMAQGLADGPASRAGNRILITHAGKTEEVEVNELLRNGPKATAAQVFPGDQVRVLPADLVFVLGDVERPGSYPIEMHEPVSVVQAMAMAGGPKRTAKMKDVVIFRRAEDGTKQEVPAPMKGNLRGPGAEHILAANDILFVPGSLTRRAFSRALDLGLVTLSGVLIWRR